MNHKTRKPRHMVKCLTISAGLIAMFFTYAESATGAPADDCKRVAAVDRALCARVKAQPAYRYSIGGTGVSGTPNGRVLVREITHQGLTRQEMGSYLRGEADNYRFYITAPRQYLAVIRDVCGKRGGKYTITTTRIDGETIPAVVRTCN